ncbi:hypothetical protein XENOCAPTIV_001313, partial [Xenoophorus captivus]
MVGKLPIHQRCQIKGVFSNPRMQSYSCRGISNAVMSLLWSCSLPFQQLFFTHNSCCRCERLAPGHFSDFWVG